MAEKKAAPVKLAQLKANDTLTVVREGLVKKQSVKDGKSKGWKQRYLVLKTSAETGDLLYYYDKKKKKEYGMVAVNGADIESGPGEKEPHRTLQLKLSHSAWRDGQGGAIDLVIELSDENSHSEWEKELTRASRRTAGTSLKLGWKIRMTSTDDFEQAD